MGRLTPIAKPTIMHSWRRQSRVTISLQPCLRFKYLDYSAYLFYTICLTAYRFRNRPNFQLYGTRQSTSLISFFFLNSSFDAPFSSRSEQQAPEDRSRAPPPCCGASSCRGLFWVAARRPLIRPALTLPLSSSGLPRKLGPHYLPL
jgi:hypothetical protein